MHFIHRSQLPPRSTRLLNRSRLQQGILNGAESPRSIENLNLINCKTALRLSPQLGRDSANGSPDDQLFMLDKILRNSLIQDVEYCKQQMLQLRSILQEVSLTAFLYWLTNYFCMRYPLYQYACMCVFVFLLFHNYFLFVYFVSYRVVVIIISSFTILLWRLTFVAW